MGERGKRASVAAAVAGILAAGGAASVSAAELYLELKQTPGGLMTDEFPDGDDGSVGEGLAWGFVENLVLDEGATGTWSARMFLTEPGDPDATLTPNCDPTLPANGFSADTDGLAYSTVTAGSLLCTWSAERLGVQVVSNQMSITVNEVAGSGDMDPPPQPVGFFGQAGDGAVVLSWDSVCDVAGGSGVENYLIRRNGGSPTTVAATPCVMPALALSDPSSLSPTFTPDPEVSGYTVSVAGRLDGNTAAISPTMTTQVTGPFIMSVKVEDLEEGDEYGKLGLYVGTADNPGTGATTWITLHAMRSSSGGYQLQSRKRVAGSAATNVCTINLSADANLRIEKVDDTTVSLQYSYDGLTWGTVCENHTIALGATVFAGLVGSGGGFTPGSGTIPTTGKFVNFNLTQNGRVVYEYETTGSASYTVQAVDAEDNVSAQTLSWTGAPEPGSSDSGLAYFFDFEGELGEKDAAALQALGLVHSRHEGRSIVVNTHSIGPGQSLQIELRPGSCFKPDGTPKDPCTGSTREEFYPNGLVVAPNSGAQGTTCTNDPTKIRCLFNRTEAIKEGDEVWVGFATRFQQINANARIVLFQMQQGGTASCGFGQPFFAHAVGNNNIGWNFTNRPWKVQNVCNTTTPFDSFHQVSLGSQVGTFQTGVWDRWVYRFKFDGSTAPNVGRVTIWQNGNQLVDANNIQFSYEDINGSMRYFHAKMPVYNWWNLSAADIIMQLDKLAISKPNEGSYELVYPQGVGR